MASRIFFLAALAVVSCVDASWLPWMQQLQTKEQEVDQAPVNGFLIYHLNSEKICLRLSTSISIQVQYKGNDDQDLFLQVIVPRLGKENVEGSCGPDAFLHLSWVPEATTQPPTPPPTEDPIKDPTEDPTEVPTDVEGGQPLLRVEGTSPFEPTPFDAADGNSLHLDFGKQDGSFFLANITGVINIVDAPDDFPVDGKVFNLSVTDQQLFKAPLGTESMCNDPTIIEADFDGNITAVNITMNWVQMFAYREESESDWPHEAKWCRASAAPKLINVVAIILGAVVALLVNVSQW